MSHFLHKALDWSEIWALFIPMLALYFRSKQPKSLQPVIFYIWIAFLLNLIIDLIMVFKENFPDWLHTNNPFYNAHSVFRFICFSIFFILICTSISFCDCSSLARPGPRKAWGCLLRSSHGRRRSGHPS